MLELRDEQPTVSTIYRDGELIGNFQFENYGRNQTGINLRWADDTGRHMIHFPAHKDDLMPVWQSIVEKYIPVIKGDK